MQVETELAEIAPEKGTLLTIGVFDGVHVGHKYLLSKLKDQAGNRDLLSGVITFKQHPRAVLGARRELPYLTSLEEKVALIKSEGIDIVVALSFTRELSDLSAREFVGLLQKNLRMKGLLVGSDFAVGRRREGDISALRKLGQEMGFTVEVVAPKKAAGEVISSTAIREALAEGQMDKVIRLTGRPFRLQGKVLTGAGRGAGLGFPTANLEIDPMHILPDDGVYATRVHLDGKVYPAVTNIGNNPTFGADARTVETYIIDYKGNLYGRELIIDVVQRLREEKRFDSVEDLKQQMKADVEQGRKMLASRVGG